MRRARPRTQGCARGEHPHHEHGQGAERQHGGVDVDPGVDLRSSADPHRAARGQDDGGGDAERGRRNRDAEAAQGGRRHRLPARDPDGPQHRTLGPLAPALPGDGLADEGGRQEREDEAEQRRGLGLVADRVARGLDLVVFEAGGDVEDLGSDRLLDRGGRGLGVAIGRLDQHATELAGVGGGRGQPGTAVEERRLALPEAGLRGRQVGEAAADADHLDLDGRTVQLRWLLVVEGPELVGRPEREHGTIADAEPAALGQRLVEEHLVRGFGGATVHHEVVAGQAAQEVVLVAHQRARHHAIVRPVDRGDRQATERATGGRLDLGQGLEQALLLDGVVLVARAEIGIGPGLQLRRAEVEEQLGDVGVGEEPVVGGGRAATGGDHRHRDARGQPGQEREHAPWRASRGGSARPPAPRSAPPHPHLASCPTPTHSTGRAGPRGIRRAGVSAGGLAPPRRATRSEARVGGG